MGALIAIGIIWYLLGKSEDKETRKKQRRAGTVVGIGALGIFLDSFINADKRQDY